MKSKIYLLLLLLSMPLAARGQIVQRNESLMEELIQELLQQEESIDYEDAYESLLQYSMSPLDLNQATSEELQNIYLLSPLQIQHLIEYKNKTGPLLSLYELQSIPEFDWITIQKLIHFVTIRTSTSVKEELQNLFLNANHYLLIRYGRSLEGSGKNFYEGDENKIYFRYKNSKPRQFSYGISLEKDAGEKIYWNRAKGYYGMDFTSFHLSLFNKGKVKAFTLGDYQLQFGQGLVMASGFRLGKGSETILGVKQINSGVRPYSSALEYGYFRGSVITIAKGPVEFTAFYSNKNVDGSLHENQSFSPTRTGYHRTPLELSKKNSVNEQLLGGNISITTQSKNFHSGFTFVKTHYEYTLVKTPSNYNTFDFSGSKNYTAGIDLNYTLHNFILFGESAVSQSKGKGMVAGFLASLSKHLETSLVYRNYERNFHSFYSNSFGENTLNANEKGLYWGLKFKPILQWTLSCYYDQFTFPWLKHMVDAPSEGNEYLVRATYQPSKASLLYFQYKVETKEKNATDISSPLDVTKEAIKRNFLFHMEIKATKNFSLRSRVQFSSYHHGITKSSGYAIMQELDYAFHPFSISLRYTLFDSDDFENRQYMYEKDVLYTFSIPAYYGQGTRTYFIIKFNLFKNVDAWVKYSQTTYANNKTYQADFSDETSPSSSDLRIQLRYTFR